MATMTAIGKIAKKSILPWQNKVWQISENIKEGSEKDEDGSFEELRRMTKINIHHVNLLRIEAIYVSACFISALIPYHNLLSRKTP